MLTKNVKLTEQEYLTVLNDYLNDYTKMYFESELNNEMAVDFAKKSAESKDERSNTLAYLYWMLDENVAEQYVENGLSEMISVSLSMVEEMEQNECYKKDSYFSQFVEMLKAKFSKFKTEVSNKILYAKKQFEDYVWQFIVQLKLDYDLFEF